MVTALWLVLTSAPVGRAGAEDRPAPQSPPAAKRLIEFGWDEPDTGFMRTHIARMEQTPFDGCVFHVDYAKPAGGKGRFTWECWGPQAFADEQLWAAVEDLKNTDAKRLTHNFLRFNVTPGGVDWFDDAGFAAIVNNARLAAKVAYEGGRRGEIVKGILFDIEQYEKPLFKFRELPGAGTTRTWDDYAQQARRRGREVMAAFAEGFPGVTVLLTFGYSLPHAQSGGDPAKLPQADYGLLAPFLDGLVDAAAAVNANATEGKPRARLVDGYELSYSYREAGQFRKAAETMRAGVLPMVAEPEKYRQVFSISFGIWMDYDWRRKGWDEADPAKNYFTPQAFEASVRAALETCDEYVWVYTETPRWWTEAGGPAKLPEAYDQALRRAKQRR